MKAPTNADARTLYETTFVVLDLETSGGQPSTTVGITEIGAVKVQGGAVIEEFRTFINPGHLLPEFITSLTGISDSMLIDAPSINEVFPDFLHFLGDPLTTVLVAHNSPFDMGFLKSAALATKNDWPDYLVIDTVRLARQVLSYEEVPNCKLGTLAQFFNTTVTPNHRALDDARATVDVLHGLFDRLGSHGVTTLAQTIKFKRPKSVGTKPPID
ncbi:MAG: exonuclease domain-containing protein [Actinobacteria bacterium]|nr:exonuclease domain-containing protein [Actinomycetota bacterium]